MTTFLVRLRKAGYRGGGKGASTIATPTRLVKALALGVFLHSCSHVLVAPNRPAGHAGHVTDVPPVEYVPAAHRVHVADTSLYPALQEVARFRGVAPNGPTPVVLLSTLALGPAEVAPADVPGTSDSLAPCHDMNRATTARATTTLDTRHAPGGGMA